MTTNFQSSKVGRSSLQTFNLEFDATTHGPIRCLGLFAQIDELPERFVCQRDETSGNWLVAITLDMGRLEKPYSRLLAKISMMPAYLGPDDLLRTQSHQDKGSAREA